MRPASTPRHLDVDVAPNAADEPVAPVGQSGSVFDVRMLPRAADGVRRGPQTVSTLLASITARIRPQPCCSCLNMSIACACQLRIPFPIVLPVAVSAGGELACITSSAHDMQSMTIIADTAWTLQAWYRSMAAHKKEKGLRTVTVLMSSCHACCALRRCRWTTTVRAAGREPSQLDVD